MTDAPPPPLLPPPPELRGIFGAQGDSKEWLEEMEQFPNGVPRFQTKEECLAFMKRYNTSHGGSNPDHPQLKHIFTTLVSWKQIESILLPAIDQARREPPRQQRNKTPRDYLKDADPASTNVYERPETRSVVEELQQRLDLPIHRCTNPASTMNTLRYLFYHMKCGIFVMMRNNQLRIFAPFVNTHYRNTWNNALGIDKEMLAKYSKEKAKHHPRKNERVLQNPDKWWANGNILCNVLDTNPNTNQHWNDQFLAPLRDMLAEACNHRDMPDCEFFLNRRDYPQLKINVQGSGGSVALMEPYGFIFDKDDCDPNQDVPLAPQHTFSTYAPVCSFYAAAPNRFADVPWPSSEDYEGAIGLVFPGTFIHTKNKATGELNFGSKPPRDLFTEANFRQFEKAWDHEERLATAFFRGTTTGGGTTVDTNQRLKLAQLSHEWENDAEKGGEVPFLNAALTGWNPRDKKLASGPMTFVKPKDFAFTAGHENFTPIYEQSRFKYLVYVDGHCAACRYAFMMRLGSVILKVASRQVADRMWFFPLLKPFHDHVPVKADLSDLEEKIRWCRANDDRCRRIASNARDLYNKYISREGLLDYVQMVCKSVASRFVEPPDWWSTAPPPAEVPRLCRGIGDCCYVEKGERKYCSRCQELVEQDKKRSAQSMEEEERNRKRAKEEEKAQWRLQQERKKEIRAANRKRTKK